VKLKNTGIAKARKSSLQTHGEQLSQFKIIDKRSLIYSRQRILHTSIFTGQSFLINHIAFYSGTG
jgi:hypothetical protein